MKIHAMAFAVLVAACVTPRPAVEELAPDDIAGESRVGETCQQETCGLEVAEIARKRVALEVETEAKMARVGESAGTKRVAEAWTKGLARSIDEERARFSKWCEMVQGWNTQKLRRGAKGLTTDDMVRHTGQPPRESKLESPDESIDGKTWAWDVEGPISHTVSFAILFMRPAGSEAPYVFGGCQWCASGGPATTRGCVTLPESK